MLPDWRRIVPFVIAVAGLAPASPAEAVPAFARKYGTSCQTCHTVFPKLSPFGEAFRRNGYRFPGIDSDFIKQEMIPLGQEAAKKDFPHSVWPSMLPGSVPLAVGFNGAAMIHPDKNSGGAQADNGTAFSTRDLVAEAHIWMAGSFTDTITYFGELTAGTDGVSLEQAKILFNDIAGPAHLFNLVVGRTIATISGFGPRSSYIADAPIVSVPLTALFGSTTDSWQLGDAYNGVEVNGVVAGRFMYSAGLNAGANLDLRPTENVYAHIGAKIGGMRLDGEGSAPIDSANPGAETALTFDAFGYHAMSRFSASDGNSMLDTTTVVGGGLRAQVGLLELNSGAYFENHRRAQVDGGSAQLVVQYNELSYIALPWLVPAVRVEWLRIAPSGADSFYDLRIMPGVAFLVLPNLKFTLVGQMENCNGVPPAGWSGAGGQAAPVVGTVTEIESLSAGLWTAF